MDGISGPNLGDDYNAFYFLDIGIAWVGLSIQVAKYEDTNIANVYELLEDVFGEHKDDLIIRVNVVRIN